MVEQIAATSEEQSSAADQKMGNVGGIVTVTKQSAKVAEHMAAAAEELNRQTESLTALVGQINAVEEEVEK